VDLDRLDLWARQLLLDDAADDPGAVAGDAATMQVIWDRSGHAVDPVAAGQVEGALRTLRDTAAAEDLAAAAAAVPALRAALSRARP
jgi:hypothetical protein